MKRSILRHNLALWLLSALVLAACTQDKFVETDTSLPVGQYPLELTASIGKAATPATHGTVDNQWLYRGTLYIASSIENPNEENIFETSAYNVFDYHIDYNGVMTLLLGSGSPTLVYWRKSDEILYIYAGKYGQLPNRHYDVEANQSTEERLNECDFLYAYGALTFKGEHKLNFRHLTSKITIRLRQSEYLKAQNPDDVKVKLATKDKKWYREGLFSGELNNKILFADDQSLQQTNEIIPCKTKGQTADIYATYEALVIPQQIADTGKTIEVKIGESTTYTYTIPCEKSLYSSGEEWIYDITVDAKGLNVSVEESIGWGNGATGDGSVVLP